MALTVYGKASAWDLAASIRIRLILDHLHVDKPLSWFPNARFPSVPFLFSRLLVVVSQLSILYDLGFRSVLIRQ